MTKRRRLNLVGFTAFIVCFLTGATVSAEVLTLDQCIDIALDRNGSRQFGLPQARISYHQAKQGVWSAWGTLLPRFTHGYNYSQIRISRYSRHGKPSRCADQHHPF